MKWCNFFKKISLILQALGCAVLLFCETFDLFFTVDQILQRQINHTVCHNDGYRILTDSVLILLYVESVTPETR